MDFALSTARVSVAYAKGAAPYAAASFAFGYLLTYYRLLPRRVLQMWFLLTAPPFLIGGRIGSELCNIVGKIFRWPRDKINNACVLCFSGLLRCWFRCSGHIHVDIDDKSFDVWESIPLDKPSVMLMNHVSFADAMIIGYHAPVGYQAAVRVMYMSKLAKIPIVGKCWPLGEHFPVHFLRSTDGHFSVDTEKQAKVQEDMIAYLNRGGRLMLFPEGAVSKNPDGELQTFRKGTFKLLTDQKIPVYMLCMYGNHETWPHNVAVGGFPCDTKMTCFKFETRYEEGETAEEMAVRARDVMQKEVWRLRDMQQKKKKTTKKD